VCYCSALGREQANEERTELVLEDVLTVRVQPLWKVHRSRKTKHKIGLTWTCRAVTGFPLSVIEMVPDSGTVSFHTESLLSKPYQNQRYVIIMSHIPSSNHPSCPSCDFIPFFVTKETSPPNQKGINSSQKIEETSKREPGAGIERNQV
jgi:hypothetical protein